MDLVAGIVPVVDRVRRVENATIEPQSGGSHNVSDEKLTMS